MRTPLPSLPRAVVSALGPVRVVRAVRIVNNKIECNGLWDPNTRTITVRTRLPREKAWWVFFHERTHMELEELGVQLPLELEELVCDAMATARVAELRRRLAYSRAGKKRPSSSGKSSATGHTR